MTLSVALALRELRGAGRSLRLLVACLILGVAAIASVGSLSSAIVRGLSEEGRSILGGDIEVRITNRAATPSEAAAFVRLGEVSTSAHLNAMVGPVAGDERQIATLRAVDSLYPLYGDFQLDTHATLQRALRNQGAVMDAELAARLGVKTGDMLQIGEGRFTLRGLIASQPDKVGEGMNFGPSLFIARDDVAATGLIQPGSLVRYHYRLRTAPALDVKAASEALQKAFPTGGWRVQTRLDGAPGTRRFIDDLGEFLTLVGLTALLVSGLGVANAVSAYLARKTATIASFKAMGATAGQIFRIYLLQVVLVAVPAILAGLVVGAALPFLLKQLLADALPVPPKVAIYPPPLLLAAGFGLLVAVIAALWPLARARQIPAARLFRAQISGLDAHVPKRFLLLLLGMLLATLALAALTTEEPLFALSVIGASLAALALLWGLGLLIRWMVARLPRPRRPLLRLAMANLHRPGNVTATVVSALGLGLTLLAVLALIQSNLARQIKSSLPEKAPTFFFLDIQNDAALEFRTLVTGAAGTSDLKLVPALRGPVTRINDTAVQDWKPVDPDRAWLLRGDRGLTYSEAVPEGNAVVEGKWWPANYSGPPLVSLEADAAKALGVKIGDRISVSILGVDMEARIANLRRINWDSLGFNFALVYSPSALAGAPHSAMATIRVDSEAHANALRRSVAKAFPTVSAVRVKDVLDEVGKTLSQVSTAITATGLVSLVSGVLVLIGAVAAGQSAKALDSVILKVLGATRRQVMTAFALEYLLLGAAASLMAVALGLAGGWAVTTRVLDLEWAVDWPPLLFTILGGMVLTLAVGLAGTWAALAARPARLLRSE